MFFHSVFSNNSFEKHSRSVHICNFMLNSLLFFVNITNGYINGLKQKLIRWGYAMILWEFSNSYCLHWCMYIIHRRFLTSDSTIICNETHRHLIGMQVTYECRNGKNEWISNNCVNTIRLISSNTFHIMSGVFVHYIVKSNISVSLIFSRHSNQITKFNNCVAKYYNTNYI